MTDPLQSPLTIALNQVITELTILSSRLTPHWQRNVDACIRSLREQLDAATERPDAHVMALGLTTVLTYDPEAGMAYLYTATPCGCTDRVASTQPAEYGMPTYHAQLDYGVNGRVLGAEFPAATKQEALERAVEIYGNVA
jgi:hypothetical protein